MQRYSLEQDRSSEPMTPIGHLACRRAGEAVLRAVRGGRSLAEIHALLRIWRDMGASLNSIRLSFKVWHAACHDPLQRERLLQASDLATGFCVLRQPRKSQSGRANPGVPRLTTYLPRNRSGSRLLSGGLNGG